MLSWERIVKLGDIKKAITIEAEVTIYWSVIHLLLRYDLKFPHLAAIIFCLGPIIINLRQGEREGGGGGEERERSGGRGEPEAYGCVTIIIYNNKLLMLCSIM